MKSFVFSILLSGISFHQSVTELLEDNTLDYETFSNFVANGKDWLCIAYFPVNSVPNLEKPTCRFKIVDGKTADVDVVGYNSDMGECELFNYPGLPIKEKTEGLDRSQQNEGRCFDSYIYLDGSIKIRFISQDPEVYVWAYFCLDGTVDSIKTCNLGFFDLLIPDTRCKETDELEMFGKVIQLEKYLKKDMDAFVNKTMHIKEDWQRPDFPECDFQ